MAHQPVRMFPAERGETFFRFQRMEDRRSSHPSIILRNIASFCDGTLESLPHICPHNWCLPYHRELLPYMFDIVPHARQLGPHIEPLCGYMHIIAPRMKRIVPYLDPLCSHVNELAPYFHFIFDRIDSVLMYFDSVHDLVPVMCDRLVPHVDDIFPHLDTISEYFDVLVPHLDVILENSDVIAPYLDDLVPYFDHLVPHLDELCEHSEEIVQHSDVLMRHLPDLLPYLGDVMDHIDELSESASILVPHLDVLIPYFPDLMPRISELLPYSELIVNNFGVLLPYIRGFIPRSTRIIGTASRLMGGGGSGESSQGPGGFLRFARVIGSSGSKKCGGVDSNELKKKKKIAGGKINSIRGARGGKMGEIENRSNNKLLGGDGGYDDDPLRENDGEDDEYDDGEFAAQPDLSRFLNELQATPGGNPQLKIKRLAAPPASLRPTADFLPSVSNEARVKLGGDTHPTRRPPVATTSKTSTTTTTTLRPLHSRSSSAGSGSASAFNNHPHPSVSIHMPGSGMGYPHAYSPRWQLEPADPIAGIESLPAEQQLCDDFVVSGGDSGIEDGFKRRSRATVDHMQRKDASSSSHRRHHSKYHGSSKNFSPRSELQAGLRSTPNENVVPSFIDDLKSEETLDDNEDYDGMYSLRSSLSSSSVSSATNTTLSPTPPQTPSSLASAYSKTVRNFFKDPYSLVPSSWRHGRTDSEEGGGKDGDCDKSVVEPDEESVESSGEENGGIDSCMNISFNESPQRQKLAPFAPSSVSSEVVQINRRHATIHDLGSADMDDDQTRSLSSHHLDSVSPLSLSTSHNNPWIAPPWKTSDKISAFGRKKFGVISTPLGGGGGVARNDNRKLFEASGNNEGVSVGADDDDDVASIVEDFAIEIRREEDGDRGIERVHDFLSSQDLFDDDEDDDIDSGDNGGYATPDETIYVDDGPFVDRRFRVVTSASKSERKLLERQRKNVLSKEMKQIGETRKGKGKEKKKFKQNGTEDNEDERQGDEAFSSAGFSAITTTTATAPSLLFADPHAQKRSSSRRMREVGDQHQQNNEGNTRTIERGRIRRRNSSKETIFIGECETRGESDDRIRFNTMSDPGHRDDDDDEEDNSSATEDDSFVASDYTMENKYLGMYPTPTLIKPRARGKNGNAGKKKHRREMERRSRVEDANPMSEAPPPLVERRLSAAMKLESSSLKKEEKKNKKKSKRTDDQAAISVSSPISPSSWNTPKPKSTIASTVAFLMSKQRGIKIAREQFLFLFNLGDGEEPLTDFTCAFMKSSVVFQGVIFVCPSYVCFHAFLPGLSDIALNLNDILDVSYTRSRFINRKGIAFVLANKTYRFYSFPNCQNAYTLFERVWVDFKVSQAMKGSPIDAQSGDDGDPIVDEYEYNDDDEEILNASEAVFGERGNTIDNAAKPLDHSGESLSSVTSDDENDGNEEELKKNQDNVWTLVSSLDAQPNMGTPSEFPQEPSREAMAMISEKQKDVQRKLKERKEMDSDLRKHAEMLKKEKAKEMRAIAKLHREIRKNLAKDKKKEKRVNDSRQ